MASASFHPMPDRKSAAADSVNGLCSPSGGTPIASGLRRASNHDSGARPATSAIPTASHAARQPRDCTSEPTSGNAAMKPMLMTML